LTPNDEYILETLHSVGLIDHSVVDKVTDLIAREGRTAIEILDASGLLTPAEILKVLANQLGMEFVRLDPQDIEAEAVHAVPAEVVRRYRVMPISKMENTLVVAVGDPLDIETGDSLRYVLKTGVECVVALQDEIDSAIKQFYGEDESLSAIWSDATMPAGAVPGSETRELGSDASEITDDDAPVIKLVSLIIMKAFKDRASDIHIEPFERKLRVRYRIDGVLQEVPPPPKKLQSPVIQRIKLMAGMSIAEKRIPQDGRIQINVGGRDLDLRVSTVPSVHGESIVMRILDKEGLKLGLPQLGFLSDDQATFEQLIHLSDGILLVTGPTGSGKTTTLYGCLHEINRPDRKIITVEDPVEYQLPGINQVHVRADIGLNFSAALRSILRQAPNIIMIGEIRDLETAEIAVNASLTGHLVFSTLHTNDAPSAISRLIDIGVKPFLVASSLRGVMAQRLVRKICDKCREPAEISDRERRLLGPLLEQMERATLQRGRGCEDCSHTGYRGRMGIFEIFVINDEVQRMIYENVPAVELRAKARELGMRTLREDGLRKVVAGRTTLDEIFRVTMGDEA
jgi:general secretion pathway protein E/type IV pilus assembly protein PilB